MDTKRMPLNAPPAPKPGNLSVRKFYFLEYFYIVLEAVARYPDLEQAFDHFKLLKQQYRLGESKFKKLTADPEVLTPTQLGRYRYTFEQVIDEAKQYGLIQQDSDREAYPTQEGIALHGDFGKERFNHTLFHHMEQHGSPFLDLIQRMYQANPRNPGLLVFPIYSPRQLHLPRERIITTADIQSYSEALAARLERDIQEHLGNQADLSSRNAELLARLVDSSILPKYGRFAPDKYNAIVTRFRKYWLNYFLRDVYKYDLSLSLFDILIYRGKQVGVIHATESYPGFSGRVVYPTSVLVSNSRSPDFSQLHSYPTQHLNLFIHKPLSEKAQNQFVDYLVKGYLSLRRTHHSYFINVYALREIVCLNMKISESGFESLLEHAYKHQLSGKLLIRMSLEVDRLPEETKAMYLKQVPVVVDGKVRNIIAIDVTKEGMERHGQA